MNGTEACSSTTSTITAYATASSNKAEQHSNAGFAAAMDAAPLRGDGDPEIRSGMGDDRFVIGGDNLTMSRVAARSLPTSAAAASYTAPSPSRRRSLSVASGQPSLESVVVKAKRAASSLWMLLHAQNCCMMAGKCPHSGCHEAKMMHLHLKTCPAGASTNGAATASSSCPTHYHGCDQARKLLAHHRQCKSLRSRQHHANNNNGSSMLLSRRGGSFDATAQHCLICSFVARQARTLLERGGPATGSVGGGMSPSSMGSGSLGSSTTLTLRKLPALSSSSPFPFSLKSNHHTVSFVVDKKVTDAVSAGIDDNESKTRPDSSVGSSGLTASKSLTSSPTNGILKLPAPASATFVLPLPPPPPPPPPSPCLETTMDEPAPSTQTSNTKEEDEEVDEDVVMSSAEDLEAAASMGPPPTKTVFVVHSNDAAAKSVTNPASLTPSPPDPSLLSEPDAASLLCSLACNLHQPPKASLLHGRRDRAVSSVDTLQHHYNNSRRQELTTFETSSSSSSMPLGLVRRRSVSLGSAPSSLRLRQSQHHGGGGGVHVDDTIYEEGSQASSREDESSLEALDSSSAAAAPIPHFGC